MNKYCITLLLLSAQFNSAFAEFVIMPLNVLGRDLKVSGAEWAGHVGIASAPYIRTGNEPATHVIETLNEHPVIQKNTIAEFKNKSRYWGSRWNFLNDEDNEVLFSLREANRQRNYCPSYTLTAFYTVGTPKRCAKFRCDTFVNYIFKYSGNTLPTSYGPTLPKLVFDAFNYGNEDGPYAPKRTPRKAAQDIRPLKEINIAIKKPNHLSNEEYLEYMNSSWQNNAKQALQKWLQMLQDPSLDYEKFQILADYIGQYADIKFIPKIIKAYQHNNRKIFKSSMIKLTQDIYQKNDNLITDQGLRQLLSAFYFDVMNNKHPITDLIVALRGLISLEALSNSTDFDQSVLQQVKNISHDHKIESLELKTKLAFTSPRFEKKYIPEILQLLKKNTHLNSLFYSLLISQLVLHNNNLSIASRSMINEYLHSIKYQYNINFINNHDQDIELFDFGAWLESVALTQTNNHELAANYILSYISNMKTFAKASYIIGLSDSNYIKRSLATAKQLVDFKSTNQDNAIIKAAQRIITAAQKDYPAAHMT